MMPSAGHAKQSSRLNKKLKLKQQLRKRGVGEKKKAEEAAKKERAREAAKRAEAAAAADKKRRDKERAERENERENKNERGNWLLKGKKTGNYNRACESSFAGLEFRLTLR
jgi:hypothetical protein